MDDNIRENKNEGSKGKSRTGLVCVFRKDWGRRNGFDARISERNKTNQAQPLKTSWTPKRIANDTPTEAGEDTNTNKKTTANHKCNDNVFDSRNFPIRDCIRLTPYS